MIGLGASNATAVLSAPGRVRSGQNASAPPGAARSNKEPGLRTEGGFGHRSAGRRATSPLGVWLAAVQYQVRLARITDTDRIVTLLAHAPSTGDAEGRLATGAGDLLRQLVGLPHAVVLVAESGRVLVGAGVLALRPSVRRGGFLSMAMACLTAGV